MRKLLCVIALLFTAATAGRAQRPAGVTVYTWTREDIFAGLLDGDFDRLNLGMTKLADILKENPKDADALVMKALGLTALATRDLKKNDSAAFNRQYDEAVRLLDEAYELNPKGIGVNSVIGGGMLFTYGEVPESRRVRALQMARRSYAFLYEAQESALANMPMHHKGEVLSGVAESEFRAGNKAEAMKTMKRIVDTMPNTPYAQRAAEWLGNPDSVALNARLICQSCHDAGRLKNRLPGNQR